MTFQRYQCGDYQYFLCERCAEGFHGVGQPVVAGDDVICERCHRQEDRQPLEPGTIVYVRMEFQDHDTFEFRWVTGVVRYVDAVAFSDDYRYGIHCPALYPLGTAGYGDPMATVNVYHSAGVIRTEQGVTLR